MTSITISSIALFVSIISIGYSIYLSTQNNILKRTQQRTQILNKLYECKILARTVKDGIVSFREDSKIAFPDEIQEKQQDVDKMERLVDEIYNEHSNYSKKISLIKLEKNSHIVSAFKKVLEELERKLSIWNKRIKQTADSKLNKDRI